jgi:hypothetical protein
VTAAAANAPTLSKRDHTAAKQQNIITYMSFLGEGESFGEPVARAKE